MGNTSPVRAEAGIMRWDIIGTPGSIAGSFDILSPSEIIDIAAGMNGRVVAIVRIPDPAIPNLSQNLIYHSNNNGVSWTDASFNNLSTFWADNEMYHVAIAPDNPDVWAVTYGIAAEGYAPRYIIYTDNAGVNWVDCGIILTNPAESIRGIDISVACNGGIHDIGIATVTGTGNGSFYISSSRTWGLWQDQGLAPSVPPVPLGAADYFSIKFSPSYPSDFSVALIYANATSTYFNVGFRDMTTNATNNYAFNAPGVEVKNSSSSANASPGMLQLVNTDLELPEDFVGQSATLRRVYISLDADGSKAATCQDGIFRIDDTHVYMLMDTTRTLDKSIYSIAYYGTYASGKLLAGEHYGFPCTATVPTWFTDTPTVCPIPCWYPALKPPTGAAAQGTCTTLKDGTGSARVAWNDDSSLAFAGTGSLAQGTGAAWFNNLLLFPIARDESAFSVSRNNGETWNQLGLIDTVIDWFNDVAPSIDCSTIYLASVNRNTGTGCAAFDSVWRSTLNSEVADPLVIGRTLGFYWERVLTRTTSLNCSQPQSDRPLLRVPQGCDDKPDGEYVAWAAQLTMSQMWSPDYGDFWAEIMPRDPIQDFTFESSTIIYDLSPTGMVQRITYAGTEWNTKSKSVSTRLNAAHTIAAVPSGKILVGAATQQSDIASFSPVEGKQWITIPAVTPVFGNVHVAFDADFANNKFVYLADDGLDITGTRTLVGTVYREQVPAYLKLEDVDMMSRGNSAHASVDWPAPLISPPHVTGQFGVVAAKTGDPEPALYCAHDNITETTQGTYNSGVCRTLRPWQAMPKYGIPWDCLDIYSPVTQEGVRFTLEPSSLKYCGCCTLDSYTTLFAIDNRFGGQFGVDGYDPDILQGMLWAYTDCLAKKGPVLITPKDSAFVGCDPVTGRNQQVDLSWEQLCLAVRYQLQIYKDRQLTMKVNPAIAVPGGVSVLQSVTGSIVINLDSYNVVKPAAWIAPGSLPEAGASYYWRIRVSRSSTGQIAVSPWSEVRSFSVKPGFIVNTPVYGVELLSPKDSCTGCPLKPTSLSWSPYKEATKYELVIAKDPEMKQILKRATTTTTGYEYKDELEYSKSYYWRVRAIEVKGQAISSDWSSTFSFTTIPSPPPEPAKPDKSKPETGPGYVWIVIAVIVIVPVAMLFLIMSTRRSSRF